MNTGHWVALVMMWCFCAHGQGTILFDTHVPGVVDSRWLYLGPLDEEWEAKLFLEEPLEPPLSEWIPLFPTTTFRSATTGEAGYVNPVLVTVPGHDPGERVVVSMRAYFRGWPEASGGTLLPVVLGSGADNPGYLIGLPATVQIPEAGTLVLAGLGAGLLLAFRKAFANQAG